MLLVDGDGHPRRVQGPKVAYANGRRGGPSAIPIELEHNRKIAHGELSAFEQIAAPPDNGAAVIFDDQRVDSAQFEIQIASLSNLSAAAFFKGRAAHDADDSTGLAMTNADLELYDRIGRDTARRISCASKLMQIFATPPKRDALVCETWTLATACSRSRNVTGSFRHRPRAGILSF
jgi:hypothetical protein